MYVLARRAVGFFGAVVQNVEAKPAGIPTVGYLADLEFPQVTARQTNSGSLDLENSFKVSTVLHLLFLILSLG